MAYRHDLRWIRVASAEGLPEGRVMTVTARAKPIGPCHFNRQWAAMDNLCPRFPHGSPQ